MKKIVGLLVILIILSALLVFDLMAGTNNEIDSSLRASASEKNSSNGATYSHPSPQKFSRQRQIQQNERELQRIIHKGQ